MAKEGMPIQSRGGERRAAAAGCWHDTPLGRQERRVS